MIFGTFYGRFEKRGDGFGESVGLVVILGEDGSCPKRTMISNARL